MKEDLVSPETIKLAKEKGFNIPNPTQSLLQKWLREKHKLHINMAALSEDCFSFILERLDDGGTTLCGGHLGKINYKTYEAALEKGLYKALENII